MAKKKGNKASEIIQRVAFRSLYGIVWLISLIPLRIMYVLSDIAFVLVYYIKPIRYRGKLVRKNLTESFPEKSLKEIRKIERKFYRGFFDSLFESLKSCSASDKWIMKHFEFPNINLINDYFDKDRSQLVYLGHMANWEWIVSLPNHIKDSRPTPENGNFVKNVCCQVYHPLENKEMDEVVLKLRNHYGATSIPMAKVFKQLLNYREEGRNFIIGMIADQVPTWNSIRYWTNLLNHPNTPVYTGVERISRSMDLVVWYGKTRRISRGHYTCTAIPIVEFGGETGEFELTERYTRMLEEDIREAPELWLWTHNRWKRDLAGFRKRYPNIPTTGATE